MGVYIGEASSDDSYSNIVSTQGGEMDEEGSKVDPCNVHLNRVFAFLEENHT